jgi:hypothetical protein
MHLAQDAAAFAIYSPNWLSRPIPLQASGTMARTHPTAIQQMGAPNWRHFAESELRPFRSE